MGVPTRRILEPIFGEPTLISAQNGDATWSRASYTQNIPVYQKGITGWSANLYGGIQTGDDWAAVYTPVYELRVPDFKSALWTYYMDAAEVYGVNMVIWAHDPNNNDFRVEITQAPSGATLEKANAYNAHELDTTLTQFLYYGEISGTPDTTPTAGTQYTWDQFRADSVFETYTIYRISHEFGWYSTGTFTNAWVADIKLNGVVIPLRPDRGGTGRIGRRVATATSGAMAETLATKTPFRLLGIELKINTAGTTDESFTVKKDATIGAAYDQLLLTQNTKTPAITDLYLPFNDVFSADDEIDCAWPNTENRTWGLTYRYQTVFD